MTTKIRAGSPSVHWPPAVHPPSIGIKQKCEQYGLSLQEVTLAGTHDTRPSLPLSLALLPPLTSSLL